MRESLSQAQKFSGNAASFQKSLQGGAEVRLRRTPASHPAVDEGIRCTEYSSDRFSIADASPVV